MPAFDEIYQMYFKDVYKYLLSLTRNEALAEELTQETFVKALDSIETFDGRCKLYVWLCQIAKHTYFSHCSRQKRQVSLPEEENIPSVDDFVQLFMDKETAFAVHRALHVLDEPYKEVFSLRIFGELSFAQIAALFGKTESWARVTYHRARLKIKEDLS